MRELPEVIRIPFEEAVRDVRLQGWEDDWFSTATYDPREHGSLEEPKIDFVYNCKFFSRTPYSYMLLTLRRGQRLR
jgi:hypothetical protein